MTRAIEEAERTGRRDKLRGALGISHYLSAFQEIFFESIRGEGERALTEGVLKKIDIALRQKSIELMLSQKTGRSAAIVAAIGSAVLILFATVNGLSNLTGASLLSGDSQELLKSYSGVTIFSAPLLVLAIYFWIYRGEAHFPRISGFLTKPTMGLVKLAWATSISSIDFLERSLQRIADIELRKRGSLTKGLAFLLAVAMAGLIFGSVYWLIRLALR